MVREKDDSASKIWLALIFCALGYLTLALVFLVWACFGFHYRITPADARLPGHDAVSVSHLSLNKNGQYNFLRAMIPEERLDGSIWLYWLDKMPGR
jgi:hypothetical protein